jgi:hypothetical protein
MHGCNSWIVVSVWAATWVCRPQDLWESKDGFMHSLLFKLVIIKVEISSITQAPFSVRYGGCIGTFFRRKDPAEPGFQLIKTRPTTYAHKSLQQKLKNNKRDLTFHPSLELRFDIPEKLFIDSSLQQNNWTVMRMT